MRGFPSSAVYDDQFWPSTDRVNICACKGGRRVWSTVTLTNNLEYAMPLTIPTKTTIAYIGVQKGATGGGEKIRMGIRTVASGTLKPNALVVDGGENTCAAAAEIQWWNINTSLDAGRYWVVYNADTSINNINGIESPTYVSGSFYGWSNSIVAADYPTIGWYCTQAYGALAATWSAVGETAILAGATAPASFYYRT